MDASKMDGYIIRKGKEYLVGMKLHSVEPRWSNSIYDAWQTTDISKARRIARFFEAEIIGFNPIIGRIREGVK